MLWRENLRARRRKFDRKRQSFERSANVCNCLRDRGRQIESRPSSARAIDKKLNRFGLANLLDSRRIIGQRQRRHAPSHFPRQAQRFTTGCEYAHTLSGAKQSRHCVGARFCDVFTIVDDDESFRSGERSHQRIDHTNPLL